MLKTTIVLPNGTEISSGYESVNSIQNVTFTQSVNDSKELTLGSTCANKLEVKVLCSDKELDVRQGEEITAYKIDETSTSLEELVILAETTLSSGFSKVLTYEMLEGQTELIVTYDGRLFTCVPHFSYSEGDGYLVRLGNQSLVSSSMTDSGEPFYFYGYKGSSSLVAKFEDTNTHTITITGYVQVQGKRHLIGKFILEKPVRSTSNTLRITGYDRVTRLDQDLGQWLAGLDSWPYSLLTFANMVCEACGLLLVNDSIPNGDYMIPRFLGQGITGRKLMQWVGEIAGRFCRATPEGKIEFAWYEPSGVSITPDGDRFYYQNGLTYAEYQVAPVEKVQLRLTENDVGVVWPEETGEKNTYIISGNYLLTTTDSSTLLPLAQTLYEQLKDVSFTPCKVVVPAGMDIHAGHTVQITDRNGKTFTSYVMTKTQAGQRDTLECAGSRRRDSTSVVNNESYRALAHKMLEIKKDVDGLFVKVSETETLGDDIDSVREYVAQVALDVGGIKTSVSDIEGTIEGVSDDLQNTKGSITSLEQTASQFKLDIQKINDDGVGKVSNTTGIFDESGLTVDNTESPTKTTVTPDGMKVYRKIGSSSEPVLSATSDGVDATNLHAKTYLIIGDRSRFENYGSNRTGCFWIGDAT